ncbi:MAG TPA: cell wall-active antibiotics response protein [Clostridiales bacterium]|nr:cell wall-active antibiotics response protein [Clostridiales bacterium]
MRNKLTNVLWGLFFVVVGIGIAGNVLNLWDFNLFFNGWWTFFIIIPCFISMIQSGFGIASTIGFIFGVLLFVSCNVKLKFSVWELIIPVILIFIGIRILLQNVLRRRPRLTNQDGDFTGASGGAYTGAAKSDYNATFSSNRIHVTDVFAGTDLNAIFGALVLDLRDAQIMNDVEINATTVFGGIDIYLPAGVNIRVNNVPVFGGVSNKSNQYAQPGAPTIYLNSTCMFGGIDIK